LTSNESNSVKIGSVIWSREVSKILGHKKGKKLETTRQWYFTHVPGGPHCGDCFEFWHAGRYPRRNRQCQILF